MTLREIDDKIQDLKNQRFELEKQEREKFKEKAKSNIGRCFKIGGNTFAKVIDVPQEVHTLTDVHFNEYQYPALYMNDNKFPFYKDTLFSAAWGVGHDHINKYEEITPEEFAAEFEKKVQKMREDFNI